MKYVNCDICGKEIKLNDIIFQQKGLCGIYCGGECYASAFATINGLTEEVVDNCRGELLERKDDPIARMKNMIDREEFFTDQGGQMTFLKPEPTVDMVNSPPHYQKGDIETIDMIRMMLTPEELKGYLKGSILKYRERAGMKIGNEYGDDLKKADKYFKLYKSEFEFTEAVKLWK